MIPRRLSSRLVALTLSVLVVGGACSGGGPVAIVDDAELSRADLEMLHPDVAALSEDDVASSVLLMVLHEAFRTRAEADFGIIPDAGRVDEALAPRLARFEARGDLDEALDDFNVGRERLRIESYLDVVRDDVSAHLVRNEGPGFDIDQAFENYLRAEGQVCIRQIQVGDIADFDSALARLDSGEPFSDVALDLSVNPFVIREDGGSGAGGDFGCSNPGSLPEGLDTAAIEAPLDIATGPVVSAIGVHLLVVYERSLPELANVRDQVLEAALATQGEEVFRVWAVSVLQEIDVEIDPAYGTWGVLPETDPVPTVVSPRHTSAIIGG